MKSSPDPQYRHRFRAEIISHAVWLYHVFSLSLRDVELLLAERGVIVSYESIRRWCMKFGASFANSLHRRRPRPGDKWHLDEVFIRIRGRFIIYGARWTRTASFWTFLSKAVEIRKRRGGSLSACFGACGMFHE